MCWLWNSLLKAATRRWHGDSDPASVASVIGAQGSGTCVRVPFVASAASLRSLSELSHAWGSLTLDLLQHGFGFEGLVDRSKLSSKNLIWLAKQCSPVCGLQSGQPRELGPDQLDVADDLWFGLLCGGNDARRRCTI